MFGASVSLLFPNSSFADVTIKMGADDGSLEFVPSRVTVRTGEKVTFENNSSFPHSIKFDEDNVPEGVDVDALYHGLMNSSSDRAEYTFDKPGVYKYACEPHMLAGMTGVIEVVPQ
jgi:plastocyanin